MSGLLFEPFSKKEKKTVHDYFLYAKAAVLSPHPTPTPTLVLLQSYS